MGWKIAHKKNIKFLKNFLLERELECVLFSSRVKPYLNRKLTNSYDLSFFKNHTILINEDLISHKIKEAILLTKHGLVLPILSKNMNFKIKNPSVINFLEKYTKKIFSILGNKHSVLKLQYYFNNNNVDLVDYHLMILDLNNREQNNLSNLNGITIRKAKPFDTDFIFELQENYEKEEVLIDKEKFNKKLCMTNLKFSLKNQIIFIAEHNGKAVSKAGTNARGFKIDQIGGVYTKKEFRGRNISALVLKELFSELSKEKNTVCLFVKKDNHAAIKLYKKIGFSIIDEYRIVYYKK